MCELKGVLTKEAVDDAKKARHGADDGRNDIIRSLYFQTANIDISHACPFSIKAQLHGISHSG